MSDQSDPPQPPQPPRPPQFNPGQATPPSGDPATSQFPPAQFPPAPYAPPTGAPAGDYPPTSSFPPVNYAPPGHPPDYGTASPPGSPPPGYGQGGYPPPGYAPPGYAPPPPPRRSNAPLIAVIVAITVLLCGGVITSGVLLVRNTVDSAKEAVAPILDPTLPTGFPTGLPTDLPTGLPTDLPTDLPTGLPDIPGIGAGREIKVTYEVTGDGPAKILYTEQLGGAPQVLDDVDLPWTFTATVQVPALLSITAQRSGGDDGEIACKATMDGEIAAQRSANGAWATTTCNKFVFD
ncbi:MULTISPECIES: MmpS family transport accessory protein [Actinoplanes]|uniref:MmpS family transport accessory protein n=1 Tax=Actinoplanes TaxID=1865 RepID=UPI000696E928|nr:MULTISPECIES: MmpS family transport accessory protein [Actinoplanes]GLY00875.1 hypothetical protein Acsp01_12540 [Actinoplanes sp. NBRC 101535]